MRGGDGNREWDEELVCQDYVLGLPHLPNILVPKIGSSRNPLTILLHFAKPIIHNRWACIRNKVLRW